VRNTIASINVQSTTGTNPSSTSWYNTSGELIIGVEKSTGSWLLNGSTPYASIICSESVSNPIQFGIRNQLLMTLSYPGSGTVGKLQLEGQVFCDYPSNNCIALQSAGSNYGFVSNTGTGEWALGWGPTLNVLGTPVLKWNASGNISIGNSLGIGTDSPGYPIDVRGGFINVSNSGNSANVYMGIGGTAVINEAGAGGLSISSADGAVNINGFDGASVSVGGLGGGSIYITVPGQFEVNGACYLNGNLTVVDDSIFERRINFGGVKTSNQAYGTDTVSGNSYNRYSWRPIAESGSLTLTLTDGSDGDIFIVVNRAISNSLIVNGYVILQSGCGPGFSGCAALVNDNGTWFPMY
jgi:hypothetical protein